jgi:hypothetical protein
VSGSVVLSRVVLGVALAGAALFLARLAWGEAVLGQYLLPVGAVIKLFFLFLAMLYAWRNTQLFERDNPARPAWRLLWLGALAFFLGQLYFAPYQIVLRRDAPFPSPADIFFMAAYPLYVAALFAFIRAYREAGYSVGSPGQRAAIAAGVGLVCALIGYVILRPVATAEAPALETFLNVAYPVLDFVLLIPTAILIRVTVPLRGGAVWKVWLALLGGFVFLCVGDVFFAYLSTLEQVQLDPFVHATYILSYGLMARGVLYQHRLLTA